MDTTGSKAVLTFLPSGSKIFVIYSLHYTCGLRKKKVMIGKYVSEQLIHFHDISNQNDPKVPSAISGICKPSKHVLCYHSKGFP